MILPIIVSPRILSHWPWTLFGEGEAAAQVGTWKQTAEALKAISGAVSPDLGFSVRFLVSWGSRTSILGWLWGPKALLRFRH